MKSIRIILAATALALLPLAAHAEVIKLGLSSPMSGAAASWGLVAEWVAKQAAADINKSGGIKIGGKTYTFEVIAYDNKYTASESAKVGQALINRDGVRYIVFTVGTAPVRALQALSEKEGAIVFTAAVGKSVKGPQFPFTFTEANTPFERYPSLFPFVTRENPRAKTAVVVNPNDAAGQESSVVAKREWERVAIKVLDTNFYERGTTEFGPLITRIVAQNPDIADFSEMPPGDVGLIISGLQEQGWKGIKVWSTGTSHADLVRLAGDAANGTYMALAGDFADWSSTEIQRRLEAGSFAALGEHMNAVSLGAWDATMAIKTAMEEAQSVDPAKVREILPGINFQSSYGLTGFGGKEEYGSPQQMLLPILITQIKDGKIVERSRVIPPELFEILK